MNRRNREDPGSLGEVRGKGERIEPGGEEGPIPALLVAVVPGRVPPDHLDELAGLCDTAGIEPRGELVQVRRTPSPSYYLGKGKTEELAALVAETGAELVVVDEELAPVQSRNLEKALDVRILDRSELILSIFQSHARSLQAQLQVELARRHYELPRLRRLWTHLDRERGGIGLRGGMGEKQIEVDRRLLKLRIAKLESKLAGIEARKQREIRFRRREFLVSLVGYTNAGKSTLLNLLTGDSALEEDRLFSTLDTRTRRWELGEGRFVLLSDTVGFIRSIPHDLVASFHATLAEAIEAQLLLVLVDVSLPHAEDRLEAVFQVLEEIGAGGKDRLILLNKIDAAREESSLVLLKTRHPEAIPLSARTGEGRELLARKVLERLDRFSIDCWLSLPHALSSLQGRIRELATILDVRYGESGAFFKVRISPDALALFESRGASRLEGEP